MANTPAKKTPAKKATTKRVRRTKAQIAADNAAEEARRLELAAERAAKIPAPVSPKWTKTFHMVNDGYTLFGKTRYRGEEITITEGTPEFELAFDRNGNFILGKTDDEQIEAYGEVKYREGPWPGLPYDLQIYEPGQVAEDGKGNIKASPAEIAALAKINKQRNLV